MSKTARGLASVVILVGSIGAIFVTAHPVEAVGPSMGGTGVPHGPSMPSQKDGGAPTPSNLRRGSGNGTSSNSSSSSQSSKPTTFGYWDGQKFVRSPGSWVAPDNGSKVLNQRAVPDNGSKALNQRPR